MDHHKFEPDLDSNCTAMSRIRHVARRPLNRPREFFVEIFGFAGLRRGDLGLTTEESLSAARQLVTKISLPPWHLTVVRLLTLS